ncbi:hypothetical protein GW7_05515 [Heterocephalus glaber]|uniref:Uncharacterized protein n=1 Tax=Heterocephalus glaber TaxID=10181 RepID=G5AS10_HETGA|nr:hypothetical protein GW7_05515 [Heterocephalus glaber]
MISTLLAPAVAEQKLENGKLGPQRVVLELVQTSEVPSGPQLTAEDQAPEPVLPTQVSQANSWAHSQSQSKKGLGHPHPAQHMGLPLTLAAGVLIGTPTFVNPVSARKLMARGTGASQRRPLCICSSPCPPREVLSLCLCLHCVFICGSTDSNKSVSFYRQKSEAREMKVDSRTHSGGGHHARPQARLPDPAAGHPGDNCAIRGPAKVAMPEGGIARTSPCSSFCWGEAQLPPPEPVAGAGAAGPECALLELWHQRAWRGWVAMGPVSRASTVSLLCADFGSHPTGPDSGPGWSESCPVVGHTHRNIETAPGSTRWFPAEHSSLDVLIDLPGRKSGTAMHSGAQMPPSLLGESQVIPADWRVKAVTEKDLSWLPGTLL